MTNLIISNTLNELIELMDDTIKKADEKKKLRRVNRSSRILYLTDGNEYRFITSSYYNNHKDKFGSVDIYYDNHFIDEL